MFLPPRECRQTLTRNGTTRVILIPDDFVLGGTEIVLRQEKDGVITIHPGDQAGWQILDEVYFPRDEADDLPVAG
jgi:virulence-associated protein VagC